MTPLTATDVRPGPGHSRGRREFRDPVDRQVRHERERQRDERDRGAARTASPASTETAASVVCQIDPRQPRAVNAWTPWTIPPTTRSTPSAIDTESPVTAGAAIARIPINPTIPPAIARGASRSRGRSPRRSGGCCDTVHLRHQYYVRRVGI